MTGHNEIEAQDRHTGQEPPLGSLHGAKVLVSGASGFIGANLVQRLLESGCEVIALVRPESDPTRIAHLLDQIELIEADVAGLQPGELASRAGRVRLVFHLAAAGVMSPDLDSHAVVETNTVGTLRMLQAAHLLGSERFIYCGSCFEYGDGERFSEDAPLAPLTQYGASKAGGWLLAQAFSRRHGVPVVGLRPFTVYGPLEAPSRLVSYVIGAALRDEQIELTAGRQRRDLVYVGDVVDGFLTAAIAQSVSCETFNLCTGEAVAVSHVVSTALRLIGSDHQPIFGAREHRAVDSPMLSGDPRKAAQRLGWTARTSLVEGLRQTIRWHEQQRLLSAAGEGTRREGL
jgi:UDP-glucose 4-epimerase